MSDVRKRRNIYLDYNAISLKLDVLAKEVLLNKFEALVMILRGGSFAGMHLAFLTDLPYHFLHFNRQTAEVRWIGEAPAGRRVLLVEDLAGQGRTLRDCQAFLQSSGFDVSTLTVCMDALTPAEPDYWCFQTRDPGARFVFPWERYRLNHEADQYRMDGLPEHMFERTAWDLDGVFVEDFEARCYHENLEQTLLERDKSPLAQYAPSVSGKDMIITGRPVKDRERTERWLSRHHIHIPAVFRDDGIETPTAESTARWKGMKAIEIGFTHYVESEAEQAIHMANLFPELRVIWWNCGRPMQIQSTRMKSGA